MNALGIALTAMAIMTLTLTSADSAVKPFVETREQRNAKMAWWREAKFGMFIHWGVYSVPAGKWEGKRTYHFAGSE